MKGESRKTYCNIFVQNVLENCGIPYPTGRCRTMLATLEEGFEKWVEIDQKHFENVQLRANLGHAVIAISNAHSAIVTPNNMENSGIIPASLGEVTTSQSGSACYYNGRLDQGWVGSQALSEVRFFYYDL